MLYLSSAPLSVYKLYANKNQLQWQTNNNPWVITHVLLSAETWLTVGGILSFGK